MKKVSDIFDAVGGPAQMARLLNLKPSTSTEMKRRQSIPARYWEPLVEGCKAAGIRGVNYSVLAAAHSHKARTG
jgi:hypothetical protein